MAPGMVEGGAYLHRPKPRVLARFENQLFWYLYLLIIIIIIIIVIIIIIILYLYCSTVPHTTVYIYVAAGENVFLYLDESIIYLLQKLIEWSLLVVGSAKTGRCSCRRARYPPPLPHGYRCLRGGRRDSR
jgi:hypothetical protein